jgi:cyclohexadienyl dehydratase
MRIVGRRLCAIGLLTLAMAASPGCTRRSPTPTAPPAPVLHVGTSGDYAPFSTDGDAPGGMDVEIAERLGRDLGMRVEFTAVTWADLAAATQRGDFDIAMCGITMRAERAQVGRYTRPYATVGAVALIRAADAARFPSVSALDHSSVRIAVHAGGHLERVARERFPAAAIEAVADNAAVPGRLLDGDADAAITDTAEVGGWLRPALRVLGPFSLDHKAYLFPADREQLALRVDEWLVAREADGWLDGERVGWLGVAAHTDPAAASRESVAALIRLRLDLMPSVAAAKRAAGLPIEDRAQEERVIERARHASSHPERAAAVYRSLIAMAKSVQQAAPSPDTPASLTDLRDAIGRIDAQLLRELDRAPSGSPAPWQIVLADNLGGPGIDRDAIDQLAAALATGQAVKGLGG